MELFLETGQVSSKFVSTLRAAISQAKATASRTQVNPANLLRELTQLHNERFITDAEFEQKRKEILNQL